MEVYIFYHHTCWRALSEDLYNSGGLINKWWKTEYDSYVWLLKNHDNLIILRDDNELIIFIIIIMNCCNHGNWFTNVDIIWSTVTSH